LVGDEKSAANKTRVLRVEYRREDQYLSIEIQPYFFDFRVCRATLARKVLIRSCFPLYLQVPEPVVAALYANAFKALKPGGRLLVHDFMVGHNIHIIYTYICVCVYVYIHVYIYTYVCLCIYI